MTSVSARLARAAICAALIAVAMAAAAELGYSRSLTPGLIAHRERQFGTGARQRLIGWQAFVRETAAPGEAARQPGEDRLLRAVNRFFNRIQSVSDLRHWGVEDYWATPSEMLSSNGADCEDYAMAKYFTLRELGVPTSRLRLVYAKTLRSRDAHLVLAYYPSPSADPLILDNLESSIQNASDRPDLIPVYTFNDDDLLWPQAGAPTIRLASTSNRKWKDVLDKLQAELTY
ncbi:MAG: transglutaminase-like cysteine peptidase [Candidatus Parcubacteria bacterium]|nr:transglutaminase-like cysteine peptidase [Burkholderiales bacterium]